jgi:hypothetical protein
LLRRWYIPAGILGACVVVAGWYWTQRAALSLSPEIPMMHYSYCAGCGLEMACAPDIRLGHCSRCGNPLKVYPYSHASGGIGMSPPNGWLVALAVVGPGVLALALLLLRRHQPVATETEETSLTFACPNCSRRLRYRPAQAGSKGICPYCQERFRFPESRSRKEEEVTTWAHGLAEWNKQTRQKKRAD